MQYAWGMAGPLFDDAFLAKIERLALVARRGPGSGSVRPGGKGGRHEFADHRRYVPGDELRYVDWHLYGRLGRLFLKEFAREEEGEVFLVLDRSASMEGKLGGALRLAGALLTIALSKGDRVRFAAAADGRLLSPGEFSGRGRRGGMLAHLEAQLGAAGGATDLDASLGLLPPRRGAGRRLLLLVSDLLTERDGRRRLARRGEDAVVFHWLAEEERRPPAYGRCRLVSAEGGEREAWVGPEQAAAYVRAWERWIDDLRMYFGRAGVRYLLTPAERPVTELILEVLVGEGILR